MVKYRKAKRPKSANLANAHRLLVIADLWNVEFPKEIKKPQTFDFSNETAGADNKRIKT